MLLRVLYLELVFEADGTTPVASQIDPVRVKRPQPDANGLFLNL